MENDRRGDWEDGVNENLMSLNAAQRIADRLVNDLVKKYTAIDKTIRGDSEMDIDGLAARLHMAENTVNLLRAEIHAVEQKLRKEIVALKNTVNGDATGLTPGHDQRIRDLEGKRKVKEAREGYFWHFVTATASGFLMVAGLLVLNWDRVEDFAHNVWGHFHHTAAPIAPVKPRRHVRKQKPIVVPEVSRDAPDTDTPQ